MGTVESKRHIRLNSALASDATNLMETGHSSAFAEM